MRRASGCRVPGLRIRRSGRRAGSSILSTHRKQRNDVADRLAFSVAAVNGKGGTNVAYSTTVVIVGQFYDVAWTHDGSFARSR